MPIDQRIKEKAYRLDPECWLSYSGKSRDFKHAMETRRIASLERARKGLQYLASKRARGYRVFEVKPLRMWPDYDPYSSIAAMLRATPRYMHSKAHAADIVICGDSVMMVPGTYNAAEDEPPPPTIATMLGYPFDVANWRIKLDDQFYNAGDLRCIANIMDSIHRERNR